MDIKKLFGYEGKNVVITGSASGMSKDATELLLELGANVYAVDLNEIELPVKQAFKANLGDKEQIDEFLGKLPEKIDCVFLCHGIATKPGKEMLVEKVDFLSQKYIAESLLPKMSENGSITFISSMGCYGWDKIFPEIQDLLEAKTWDEAIAWYEAHPDFYDTSKALSADYAFAKMSLSAYVVKKCQSPEYINKKIRLNAICPGDTTTSLSSAFYESASGTGDAAEGKANIASVFLDSWGGRSAKSYEMGYPLVCIGSDIFSYMSGQNIYIDYGLSSKWTAGALCGETSNAFTDAKDGFE
jgi:NAD(P)-dependent dehydrogenase (short-subunit alcohol dehydrogenase family)